jgi:hypothetical protein
VENAEHMYVYSRMATLPGSGAKTTILNNHIVRKTNLQLSRAFLFKRAECLCSFFRSLPPNPELSSDFFQRLSSGQRLSPET